MSVRSRLEQAERLAKGEVSVVDIQTAGSGRPKPYVLPPVEEDPSMPGIPTVAAPTTGLAPVETPVVAEVTPVAPAPVVAPEIPTPAPAPEVTEQRYEWQPRDDAGRPMGGKQVYIYRAPAPLPQDVLEQVTKGHEMAMRQLRKERREKALGVPERIDDAEKFQNVVEFKPRDLSADERFNISQGIANPETFADARDQLLESAFGVKPSVLAATLNDLQRREIQARAVENYIEFVQTAGFEDNPENRALVTGWLGTRNLAPTVANFVLAQKRLTEAGLLQEVPVVRPEPVPTPAPAPVAAPAVVTPVEEAPKPQVPTTPQPALAAPELQAKRHSHVPSGLNPSVASPAGSIPVVGNSLTLADIDKMPADEYKRRVKDPAFMRLVNQLEEDAAKRRRARQQGQ